MGDLFVCSDDGGQGCAVEVKTNSKKSEFGPMIGHKATKCQQPTVATTTMSEEIQTGLWQPRSMKLRESQI
jgi:hypothetical protein